MLPVSSSELLLGLSPPLPLELVKALLLYLDAPGLFTLAETSKGGRWLLDEEGGSAALWRGYTLRCLPPPAPVPVVNAPQPLLALLLKEERGEGVTLPDPATTVPSRKMFAAFHRLRVRAVRTALAPLLPATTDDKSIRKEQPQSLVSQYFQAHDALAALRATGEAADAVLAQQLASQCVVDDGDGHKGVGCGGRGGATRVAALAPVALLLALHVLHRLVQSEGPSALDGWRRWALKRLARGPFVGMAAVAYWTMGSHNPFGFRARDVLRKEQVDLRQLALGILQRTTATAANKAAAIPATEEPAKGAGAGVEAGAGEDAGVRLLARLEALRGMMPVAALDPPVMFVEAAADPWLGGSGKGGVGGGAGRLVVNAQGHFELSTSPPRR